MWFNLLCKHEIMSKLTLSYSVAPAAPTLRDSLQAGKVQVKSTLSRLEPMKEPFIHMHTKIFDESVNLQDETK